MSSLLKRWGRIWSTPGEEHPPVERPAACADAAMAAETPPAAPPPPAADPPQEAGKDSVMAHPEKVNLERVLGQMATTPSADTRLQSRTWRVVREDGSKAALPSGASPEPSPAEPAPASPAAAAASTSLTGESRGSSSVSMTSSSPSPLSPPNLGFLGGRGLRNAAGLDLAAADGPSARSNIGMPKASPTLTDTPPSPAAALGKAAKALGKTATKSASRPAPTASRLLASAPATSASRPAGRPRAASGASSHDARRDLQLLRVIDAWPSLSVRAREAILAVIDASCGR